MKFDRTWTGNWENAFRGLRHPYESYNKSDSVFGLYEHYEIDNTEFEDTNYFNYEDGLADTCYINSGEHCAEIAVLGQNDLDLAKRMIKAGTPNDKFLRQIFVSVDITAPLYWWKEMDTYKVGTVANSTSTMHKLASTPITIDCFETDDYKPDIIFDEGRDTSGDNPFYYKVSVEDVVGTNEDNYYWGETIIGFLEALRLKHLDYAEKAKAATAKEDAAFFQEKAKLYWKELIRWLPESWLQTRTWTCNYAVLRNIIKWRRGHKLSEWASFIEWCHTLPYSSELLFFDMK